MARRRRSLACVTAKAPIQRGLTQVEVLVIVAVLAILVGLVIPWFSDANSKANRVTCNNHMKNVGLVFRIFATDHAGRLPYELNSDQGGTKEVSLDPNRIWQQFAVLSNELVTPAILNCPSDGERRRLTSFAGFTNNRYLSYFLRLGADTEDHYSILAGDRNLVLNGRSLSNEVQAVGTNGILGFDQRIHNQYGNIGMADGSVGQVSSDRVLLLFKDDRTNDARPFTLLVP